MTERLRVREIDDDEGRRLMRIIRRGSGAVVTWRRAQMVLLPAQGMDVPAIAKVAGLLTGIARRTGVSGYPGDGTQRWPAVHALDAAVLFRLVLENAPAGTAWHAVDDEGDAVHDIAAVIGRRLGLLVESVPAETYGPLASIFATDQPSSSAHTR